MGWMNVMTRQLNNPFSNFYAKQAQITNYHPNFLLMVAPNLASALVLTMNLYMQSPSMLSSTKNSILEEVFTRRVCEDLCPEFHPVSHGTTMARGWHY
jgi:hypothetical protein